MKKFILIAAVLLLLAPVSLAAVEMQYGSLNVFSKIVGANIYVDGNFTGKDSTLIKQIQAGSHFVKVTTSEATNGSTREVTVYADVVEVNAGQATTIYVSETGIVQPKKKVQAEEVDVFKTKRVLDYSKEMHTGWYAKIGYLQNLYHSIVNSANDKFASNLDIGLGFKIPLAPNVDFTMEMERATLSSSKADWYLMPITANIQISYMPSQYFRGKQYYGLGLGYFMTDLESEQSQNLTSMGYKVFYGLEMPASDKSAYFFEFGSLVADMSRYDYQLIAYYASFGFRWDVAE
jgi:hypothetical protein